MRVIFSLVICCATLADAGPPLRWRAIGVVDDVFNPTGFVPHIAFAPGDLLIHDFSIDDAVPPIFSAANLATFPAVVASDARVPARGVRIVWNPGTEVTLLNLAGTGPDLWDWSANTPGDVTAYPDQLASPEGPVGFTQFGVSFDLPPEILGTTNPPAAVIQPSPAFAQSRYEATWAESPDTVIYTLRFAIDTLAVIGGIAQPFLGEPADQVIDLGQTAVLTAEPDPVALVNAAGRWTRDGVPLTDTARITGSTTPQLTITDASAADTGFYAYSAATTLAADLTAAPLVADLRLDIAPSLNNLFGASLADPLDPVTGPAGPLPLTPTPDGDPALTNEVLPGLTFTVERVAPDLIQLTRTATAPTVFPGTFTLTIGGLPADASTITIVGSTLDNATADLAAPGSAGIVFTEAVDPVDPGIDVIVVAVQQPQTFITRSAILAVREPTPPCPPDIAAPTGVLDLADIDAFIDAFTAGCD